MSISKLFDLAIEYYRFNTMNDKKNDQETEHNDENEHEVLKTFDMYHFFSRFDVILAIIFIIVLLAMIIFMTLPPPAA